MTQKTLFYVSIDGQDVSTILGQAVTGITISDQTGESAGTASLDIDDREAQIGLPKIGGYCDIGMMFFDAGIPTPTVIFSGEIDSVLSTGDRGGGMGLSIGAKTATATKTKLKEQFEEHEDDTTFGEVARKWGKMCKLDVLVHKDLENIPKRHWSMNNESYPAWAERMKKQFGAVFKIEGTKAGFVPKNAGVTATGKPLTPIFATRPGNVISWSLKPLSGRPQHKKIRTRRFDIKTAKWVEKLVDVSYETEAEAEMTTRFTELTDDDAERRSKSKEKDTDSDRGGGTIEMDAEPNVQCEAPCFASGLRPGVDGKYKVDGWTHSYNRGGGWTTSVTVAQPGEGTGKDNRA